MGCCEKRAAKKCHGAINATMLWALKGFLLDFGADVQHCACSAVTGRESCKAHSRYLTGHLLLKKSNNGKN